jgi:hypothetical protein
MPQKTTTLFSGARPFCRNQILLYVPRPPTCGGTEEARNFVRDDIRVSFSADGEAEVPPFRIVIFRRLLKMFLDVLGGVSTAGKAGDAAPGAGFPVVRDVACENPRRQFDVQVARESV